MIWSTKKLENFILAFGATRLLLQRAYGQGFLLEGLVLYASLIDGFCRIGLVLKEQIENGNSEINMSYVYQNRNKYYSERQIYKLAHEKEIINFDLYKEINALYDIRNKAVHRFFTSNIEYSHLEIVLDRFERIYQKLLKIIYDLESEQIKKGVGMTVLGKYSESDKKKIRQDIYYKKIKSGDEKILAKTLGYVSVKEVVEFASQKCLLQKCKKCDHLKIEHFDIDTCKKEKNNTNLDYYIGACRSKNCKCKKYEER